jgi:hypothetical protein
MEHEAFETYEAPEVYELGQAEELTLGVGELWPDGRGGERGFGGIESEDQ